MFNLLKRSLSMSLLMRLIIGVPVVGIIVITLVQLPRLMAHAGNDPALIGLMMVQGGLPLLPYLVYALALWFATDMIVRTPPESPQPHLIKGLSRTGMALIAGSLVLYFRQSEWVWREVYNNRVAQHPGTSNNFFLLATVILLIGAILIVAAGRIRHLSQRAEHLKTELEQFV